MQNCLTPAKQQNKPLKTAILQRISSKKKKTIQQLTMCKTHFENSKFQQSQLTYSQQLILSFQNINSPGFFSYMDWLSFNQQNFKKVTRKIIDDLWKIMRMLNYGQVLIPSGLIHDVYLQLSQKQNKGLQNVFNTFLKANQINDSVRGFKDLNHYTDIKTIEQQYKGIQQNKNKKKRCNSACSSISVKSTPQNNKKDVFTRIHQQARTRTNKKMSLVCSQITKQIRQCRFKPEIHKYQTHQNFNKPQRICHDKQAWKSKPQDDIEPITKILKAKKIDQTLFQVNIHQIPGVLEHISRNKFSQAQRQRLKRYQQRPIYSSKKKKS